MVTAKDARANTPVQTLAHSINILRHSDTQHARNLPAFNPTG